MVQLKPFAHGALRETLSFQFQYGTIKTINKTVEQYYNDLFQFQYGTIKTRKVHLYDAPHILSIPVWYN